MLPKSPRSNLKTPEKKSNKHVTWKEASSNSSSREVTPRRALPNPSPRAAQSPSKSLKPIKQSPKSPSRSLKRFATNVKLTVKKPRVERFTDPSEVLFKANNFFRNVRKSFKDKKAKIVDLYLKIQDEVRDWKKTESRIYEFEHELKRATRQLKSAEDERSKADLEAHQFSVRLVESVNAIIQRVENLILDNRDMAKPQIIVLD
ncbi:unnamed protein product [Bursaphelenchus xylophilus]|uniref:(pine wood nematode) hypothetical protein n=1 Tax=Bursaphelenchus xylophilus TaxID=6326 RepID=A0A1I7SW27_BURXY|nr:unnamed protein product [Bursaphelenchus xylophilus]CAG9098715.1 unnamed protein product [Bursaphelenchus xylophilus]